MSYYVLYQEPYLMHHGVKGMKWGVRRYQNKDGSLTSAGKRHYDVNVGQAQSRVTQSRQAYDKAYAHYRKNQESTTAAKALAKANNEMSFAKQDLKSAKILDRINKEQNVSKHRLELEKHYKSLGMSDEEAAVAAYKRDIAEKVLLASLGVAAASAIAYGAHRYHQTSVDKIIKSGTEINRISPTDTAGVHDAFYAAINKRDSNKYLGLYGKQLMNGEKPVFQKTMEAKSDLKIASDKTASSILKDMISSDPAYKKQLMDDIGAHAGNPFLMLQLAPKQRSAFRKANKTLAEGKYDSNVYKAVNQLMAGGYGGLKSPKMLQDMIKSKGFDGLPDVNDRDLSGYNARSPMILFNSDKILMKKVREIDPNTINKRYGKEIAQGLLVNGLGLTPYAAIVGGAIGTTKAVNLRKERQMVAQYRKEHPGTKKSYNEIVRSYYNRGL